MKNIIKTTARLDNYTGAIAAPGDTKWGMGKINAYAAVKLALNTLSLDEQTKVTPFVLYPNPASGSLHLLNINEVPVSALSIVSLEGKVIQPRFNGHAIDISDLSNGVYLLKIQTETETHTLSFVKE